ncbi:tetratricopeptide repeat protein [Streptomyces yaizuensis]|uniref:Tetratricopeptide repeat protein n=1 Tax=Streptomyces yaizuensis TaxID=2989713 RepID=A0ABQ5NT93_9ACTN|nr:tetratricopeptide repeat protein [Streptomyces sp. YSPA8]GLF93472.1 tetratricopeptide repeat protein [Streptomyces sp. YSPA8]
MGSERTKNAAVAAMVVTTLVGGVLMVLRDGSGPPPPAPGPAARARAAAVAGAPASRAELTALITERTAWLREHPGDEESWAVLGTAYAERAAAWADWAALPRAQSALDRSLRLLPAADGNTEALLGLAALAGARQQYTAARDAAVTAQRQRPRRWTVYRALIDAQGGIGAYKAVHTALDRLTGLYDGPQARALSAQVYRERGWREDAAANAYDAVADGGTTERATALSRLGDLAWERGEPAEALPAYDSALRLAPELHGARAGRARSLAALGRADAALREYGTALARFPLPEYALEAGEVYESLGRHAEAEKSYTALLDAVARAERYGVDQELVRGRYEADHGDPEEAVRRLTAAWEAGRRSSQIADALAWALYRSGEGREALVYAKRATKEGRSPLFMYHRGQIERSLGLYGPARRNIGTALRVNPYFSPLLAPAARSALASLGEPPAGGPRRMTGREGRMGSTARSGSVYAAGRR